MGGLISDHYLGEKGRRYAEGRQDSANHLGYILQAKLFAPYLTTDDDVLDFGCGNGSLARLLTPTVRRIAGVEVNEYAARLALAQGLEVFPDLSKIPVGRVFSKVITNHVLEHIPNVFETLRLIQNLLVNHGELIAVVPIEDFRERRNRRWKSGDYDRHFYTWTPLLFGNLLDEAGFRPKRLEIVTSAWSPKLFFLGDGGLQRVAGHLLARLRKRRQLLAIAEKVAQ